MKRTHHLGPAQTAPLSTATVAPFAPGLTVQRNFRREYGQHPPDVRSITRWNAKFVEPGNVGDREGGGRPGVGEETLDVVCDTLQLVRGNQLAVPHMNFTHLTAQW
jgi:hypothetical protein